MFEGEDRRVRKGGREVKGRRNQKREEGKEKMERGRDEKNMREEGDLEGDLEGGS